MAISIQDWIVEIDVDTSKVEKKLSNLENRMQKLFSLQSKADIGGISKSLDLNSKFIDDVRTLTSEVNKLKEGLKDLSSIRGVQKERGFRLTDAQQLRTSYSIDAITRRVGRELGDTSEEYKKINEQAKQLKDSITSVDSPEALVKLRERIRQLREESYELLRNIRRANAETFRRQQRQFRFTDVDAFKVEGMIDAVVRRAGREFGETSDQFAKISREAEVLRERIKDIDNPLALEKLRRSIREFREETNESINATRRLNKEIQRQRFVANATRDSIRNLARSYVSVFTAIEVGRSIFRTMTAFEDLSASMLLSSGSAEQAAKDFEYLQDLSIRLGLNLVSTSESFAKFSVAARSSGLTGEQTRDIFTKLSESIRATGLSADRAGLAMLGFRQMLSGPVVQGQEMNQVIDQMPQFAGAAVQALKEMGYEVDNYKNAIETGTVSSLEFVTRVADIMASQARETGALGQAMNSITAQSARLKAAWERNVVGMFEEGTGEGLSGFIKSLTELTESLRPLFRLFGRIAGSIFDVTSVVLQVTTSLVNSVSSLVETVWNLSEVIGMLNRETDETNESLNIFSETFNWVASILKKLVGFLMLPLGLIERLLVTLSSLDFSSPVAFYKSLKKSDEEFGQKFIKDLNRFDFTGTIWGPLVAGTGNTPSNKELANMSIQEYMAMRANRASERASPQKTNSDNVFHANITIANGDPETVRETLDAWWQDQMKLGI